MDTLRLTAAVNIQAAAEPSRPARVSILAYTGGPMSVSGFGEVVIDLAGIELGASVVLLADHLSDLRGVVGSGVPRVEAGARLLVEGTLARTADNAQKIISLAAEGISLQASVGASVVESSRVKPGERIAVNDRTIVAGPKGLTLVSKSKLLEVSILPLGADSSTSVSIAARRGARAMSDTEIEAIEADPIAAERDRTVAIIEACGAEHADIRAKALAGGWTLADTKSVLFDITRRRADVAELRASRANHIGVRGHAGPDRRSSGSPEDVLLAACFKMAGRDEAIVKHLPDGERLAAGVTRPSGWHDLAIRALQMEGRPIPSERRDILAQGWTTTSMPYALGTSIRKLALDVFMEESANFLPIVRIVPASDFRTGVALRLTVGTKLEKVGPGGEIKHGGPIGEDAYQFRIATYAKMISLTREAIINDDASLLNDIPNLLGAESSRTISDLVFTELMAQAGTFFTSGRGNYLSGGSSPLSVGSLSDAIKAMRSQVDADGRVLNLQPAVLLVGPSLETTARMILNSIELSRAATNDLSPTASPFTGMNIQLVVEPRLENTSYTGSSLTAWYLLANPRNSVILLALLDGKLGATIESADTDFNTLGRQWRATLDAGVSMAEYRAAVRSAGA